MTSSTEKASVSAHSEEFCLVPITGACTQGLENNQITMGAFYRNCFKHVMYEGFTWGQWADCSLQWGLCRRCRSTSTHHAAPPCYSDQAQFTIKAFYSLQILQGQASAPPSNLTLEFCWRWNVTSAPEGVSGWSLPACSQTLAQLKCLGETRVGRRKASCIRSTIFPLSMTLWRPYGIG